MKRESTSIRSLTIKEHASPQNKGMLSIQMPTLQAYLCATKIDSTMG